MRSSDSLASRCVQALPCKGCQHFAANLLDGSEAAKTESQDLSGPAFLACKAVRRARVEDIQFIMRAKRKVEGSGVRLGAGLVRESLRAFPENRGLGPEALLLAETKEDVKMYSDTTQYGCLVLAGTLERFRAWRRSQSCFDEA